MKLLQRIFVILFASVTTVLYIALRLFHEISIESRDLSPCVPPEPEVVVPHVMFTEMEPEMIVLPRKQYGLGIDGKPVEMNSSNLPKEDILSYREGYEADDFNGYLSDLISVHRIVDDYRPQICKSLNYRTDLPGVGVVIPFKNEHLSILLRTVYSVLYNTPAHLLNEIVLVDDGSTNSELGSKLDIHIRNLPMVRVIRLQESRGLMMARQAGIEELKSEYFVCMDCHMEVLPGWIEPLLNRLLEEPKALLCSNVGSIHQDTFGLNHAQLWQIRGTFPFLLFNLDTTVSKYTMDFIRARSNDTWPFPFGIIQGMMIVMRRSWFLQLGGFDPGMKIWGSEQMELSIKVWTCGGRVEMIPCSFVAHMYRRNVWKMKNEGVMNILRVAEVWLDEHKYKIHEYYNNRRKVVKFFKRPSNYYVKRNDGRLADWLNGWLGDKLDGWLADWLAC
ncbi:Ricin-type beta-trefoil [Mactra antiquata]